MTRTALRTAAVATCLTCTAAAADDVVDPLDLGVIHDDEVVVVQRMLYPKTHRVEVGAQLAWAAWDRYLTTPSLQVTVDLHHSEALALSVVLGGGYGLKNGHYRELERDYGVAPYSFRYLGSALVGAAWAPIYAKASVSQRRVVHHDLYGVARAGVTAETSVIPEGGFALAPTGSLGLGVRVFTHSGLHLRLEARDDLVLEHRKLTGDTAIVQRFWVGVGVSRFTAAESE